MSAPNKDQYAGLVTVVFLIVAFMFAALKVFDLAVAPARWTIVTDDKGHWGFELPWGQDPPETFNTEAEAIAARDQFIVIYTKPKAPKPYIPWHAVK